MSTLAEMLRQDAFPALQRLCLFGLCYSRTSGMANGDESFGLVAKGLLDAPRTRLVELNLYEVGISNEGMTALASLVRAGRLDRLEELHLGQNVKVSDSGICALARAIDDAGKDGLPMLSKFDAEGLPRVAGVGVGALAHALITNCPRLTSVALGGSHANRNADRHAASEEAMLQGMLLAAGCRHRVSFSL